MCGIVCAFDLKEKISSLRPKVLEMSKKVRNIIKVTSKYYDRSWNYNGE